MGDLREEIKDEISKWFDRSTPIQDIEDITDAVLALILKKLPEKKTIINIEIAHEPEKSNPGLNRCGGYNQALSEVRSILESGGDRL